MNALRRITMKWLAALGATPVLAQTTAGGWPGAQVLWRGDHPRIIAVDGGRAYLVNAPFQRGIAQGTSGLLVCDLASGSVRFLMRSNAKWLPNVIGPCFLGNDRIYWLNGLDIMQTTVGSGETSRLSTAGSPQMAMHGGVLYSFNHNNDRRLRRIALHNGETTEMATLPYTARGIIADAGGVYININQGAGRERSGVARVDALKGEVRLVHEEADPSVQIRVLAGVPGATAFGALYLVQRDVRRNRAAVKHFDMARGLMSTLDVPQIAEMMPVLADAEAFHYCVGEGTFHDRVSLYRLPHGARAPTLVRQGTSSLDSLMAADGKIYWTDKAFLYRTAMSGQ
jgi:hypothetical protein